MKTDKLTCEKARDISIVKTLETLGHFPKRKTEKEAWFLSPFRSETQASFKVNKMINRWYDHGIGKGGNVIDLVMELNGFSVSQTLEFLNSSISSFSFHQQSKFHDATELGYTIKKVHNLKHKILLNYLLSRGIDGYISKAYCQEIHYELNHKNYFAIAFKNDSDGYEIRNKYFKGALGKKDITSFKKGKTELLIFEGFIDFLSYQMLYPEHSLRYDLIVLNSISLIEKNINIIKGYDVVFGYLDNDKAGKHTSQFLKQHCRRFCDRSTDFKNFKDVNEYLISKSKNIGRL